jgi:flagellar protein FliO/FliZ
VLKNYSEHYSVYSLSSTGKQYFFIIFLLFICFNVNATEHIVNSSAAIEISDYLKVLLGLLFVIALFLLSTFLFKRFGNTGMTGRGQLRLIDGLHLGSRERLVLVELEDKQILLSITPGQVNKLHTMDIPSTVETTDA